MRRLKTLRRPPIYPKTPGHLPCSSLTHPLPLSSRRPSVSFGGFGLTDTSLGSPTFWEWDFNNDGKIDSNQQGPTFTYDTAGTYIVTLRVSRDGLSDELIRIDPLIVEPVADFQVDITLGNAPLTVRYPQKVCKQSGGVPSV